MIHSPLQRKHQGAFTLIEVLVALLILGISILGFLSLQSFALQSSFAAEQRTQISLMAADLAEQVKANNDNAASFCGAGSLVLAGWHTRMRGVIHDDDAANPISTVALDCTNAAGPVTLTVSWDEQDTTSQGNIANRLVMEINR